MALKIYQADAFTDKPFSGNPAAVCILSSPYEKEWAQNVAAEMNLAETAFLLREKDGYNLRWFTPAVEVDLCGHATLASAHILWEQNILPREEEARFYTRSGRLNAKWKDGWIELDFPAEPPQELQNRAQVALAIGADVQYVGVNRFDYIAEVASEEIVKNLKPDIAALKSMPFRGIMVTSRSESPGIDFVSRFFCPAVGIDEDPVTGSAHCCLGPYWQAKTGKAELTGYQESKRGGTVKVRMSGDRAYLTGQAVTILRGEMLY